MKAFISESRLKTLSCSFGNLSNTFARFCKRRVQPFYSGKYFFFKVEEFCARLNSLCFWSGDSEEEQFLIKAHWHIDPPAAPPRRPISISSTLDAFTGNQLKSTTTPHPPPFVFQLPTTRVSPMWGLNMVYSLFWSMTPAEEAVLFVCTVTLRVLCHRAVLCSSTKWKMVTFCGSMRGIKKEECDGVVIWKH